MTSTVIHSRQWESFNSSLTFLRMSHQQHTIHLVPVAYIMQVFKAETNRLLLTTHTGNATVGKVLVCPDDITTYTGKPLWVKYLSALMI